MTSRVAWILIALWVGSGPVVGQRLNRADRAMQRKAYVDAVQWYEESFQRNPELQKSWKHTYQLASAYAALHDYDQSYRVCKFLLNFTPAELGPEWHSKALKLSSQMLASLGRYTEAALALDEWMERYGETSTLVAQRDFYRQAQLPARPNYEVSYVSINTHQAEFSPTFYREGLVFVSNRAESSWITRVFDRTKAQFLDLYRSAQLPAENGQNGPALTGGASVSSSSTLKPNTSRAKPSVWGITPDSPIYAFRQYRETSNHPVVKINQAIQAKLHEGPATFYHTQSKVIFTGNERRSGRIALYSARIQGDKWVNVEAWPFRDGSYGHPSLRKDDQVVYYISDRPGGVGGTDLYMSRRRNNEWSEPINLGALVNTPGEEMFPFIDHQGILYFASNHHPGLGGMDIFAVQTNDAGFPMHTPVHLGAGINSSADDFGIAVQESGTFGYFSSNRKRGGDDDDIYSFRRDEPLVLRESRIFQVLDSTSHRALANVQWSLGQDRTGRTDSSGIVEITRLGLQKPVISWEKEGYYTKSSAWPISPEQEIFLVSIPIPPPTVVNREDPTPLPSPEEIAFASPIVAPKRPEKRTSRTTRDKIRTTPFQFKPSEVSDAFLLKSIPTRRSAEVQSGLSELIRVLKENPDLRVEIRAHTDSRGRANELMRESLQMALQAATRLRRNGIVASRIRAIGKGGSTPLNECAPGVICTEEEYLRNQRIEFWLYRLSL